ncbi:uncharacterized protein LOC135145791 [Zophobas morio]|uniref:uncharacterized protein LOC135145791 n=1 Tax=Zophobas morio TaxID=2755281 RepID=UPI003082BB88
MSSGGDSGEKKRPIVPLLSLDSKTSDKRISSPILNTTESVEVKNEQLANKAFKRVSRALYKDTIPSLKHILAGYSRQDPLSSAHLIFILSFILLDAFFIQVFFSYEQILILVDQFRRHALELGVTIGCLFFLQVAYRIRRPRTVYLIDFQTFKPSEELAVSHKTFVDLAKNIKVFDEESLKFQERLLSRNGVGENTYLPPAIMTYKEDKENLPKTSELLNMKSSREEAELVMFTCIHDLLNKTKCPAKNIDILIVNCSLFNPTPSLSSMVVNKFKMRNDIRSYNLSGMGCSAGLISIDLAKDLLQVHRNTTCLVFSTENITQNWYLGKEKSMLLANTLFRLGGAAVLLSNKRKESSRSKYVLLHTVRTHRGADDPAYYSIYQTEDNERNAGVRLSKSIMDVSGSALRQNISTLGPLILPFNEQFKFFINFFQRTWLKKRVKPYMPNFRSAVQHFCIHTGGRAVIDTLEEVLKLTEYDCEPSRYALDRFGNTSSASIWYELEFIETAGRVKRHDRVWQIAFGSGFKCNSAVWKAIRDIPQNPS